jgi:hypothetical protein
MFFLALVLIPVKNTFEGIVPVLPSLVASNILAFMASFGRI